MIREKQGQVNDYDILTLLNVPVAQWIEHHTPKVVMLVRFQSGTHSLFQNYFFGFCGVRTAKKDNAFLFNSKTLNGE